MGLLATFQQESRRRVAALAGKGNGAAPAVSIIGTDLRIEGELHTAGVVQIEGTVVGNVRAEREVILAEGGVVEGDIHAGVALLGGKVRGSIVAAERVEVQATALVDGDITTERLVIHEGGKVNGHLRTGNPQAVCQQAASAGPGDAYATVRTGILHSAMIVGEDQSRTA